MNIDIAREFDSLTEDYSDKINRWVPHYSKMVSGLYEYLPENLVVHSILDLGAGTGNVACRLLARYPSAYYTLLDASSEMIRVCEERFVSSPRLGCRLMFLQEAEFEEETFDLIASCLSLHHLNAAEKRELFTKAYDWLRPGSVFVFSDFFFDRSREEEYFIQLAEWKEQAAALGTTKDEWDWIMEHHLTYDFPDTMERQVQWLRQTGFREVVIPWREHVWGVVMAVK